MKSLLFLGLLASAAFAGEEEVTHRVKGLFAPEREGDLRAALEKIPGVTLVLLDFNYAEAVFRYNPAIAFPGTKPDKIIERFDSALRSATHSTLGIGPGDPMPKSQLTRLEIPVAGLDCQACAFAVYQIVAKIEGVAAATVDFKTGLITAQIDPAKTTQSALEEALKKRNVALR